MTTLLDTFLPRVRRLLFPYPACTPAFKCPEELPDFVRIALLEAEVAQLRLERDSFAELATSALLALQQRAKEPVKLWVKAKHDMFIVGELVRRDHVEGMAAVGHPWRRLEIRPVFPEWRTTRLVAPVRASIPPEIFDHIGLFVNRKTSLVLCQVDYAWLTRFFPLNKRLLGMDYGLSDRARFVSLLSRGRASSQSSSLSRVEPFLSLRNLQTLSLASPLISDDTFPELSLANLGLGGTPLPLDVLTIHVSVGGETIPFSPNLAVLGLFDPKTVRFANPFFHFRPAGRNTIRISRAAADIICGWSRLRTVYQFDMDLHVTPDDQHARDPATHEFFLHLPRAPETPRRRLTNVTWEMQTKVDPGPERDGRLGPRLLREPVQYFATRKPLVESRIKTAMIVIKDDEERKKEKARPDVPAMLKIQSRYSAEKCKDAIKDSA